MVDVKHLLLRLLVPCQGVGLVRRIKRGIGPQGAEQCPFVVWGAPEPAVRQAGPGGDRIARRKLLFPGVGGSEVAVGVPAGAGVCGDGEHLLERRVVQGIVQAGNHAGRIAKGRVRRDILDTLAVEPDFTPIAQALQIFRPGQRAGR